MRIQWKIMKQDLKDDLAVVLSPGYASESPGGNGGEGGWKGHFIF